MIQRHLCSSTLELSLVFEWRCGEKEKHFLSLPLALNSAEWLYGPVYSLSVWRMLAVILSMHWDHERTFAYVWSCCTISNLANTCMDSLHTSDLSPQTQFHILAAIKVLFWMFCYFGLRLLSMCLTSCKPEKGAAETISFIQIWEKVLSGAQPSFFLALMQHCYSGITATLLTPATRG